MKTLTVAALLVTSMLLAGCGYSNVCYEPGVALAGDLPENSEAGEFETAITITVVGVEPDGSATAIPAATVATLIAVPVPAKVKAGLEGAANAIADGTRTTTTDRLVFMNARLASNADGQVVLRVPQGSILRVAATAPGRTEEGSARYGATDDPALTSFPINLYRPRVAVKASGEVPAGARVDPVLGGWHPIAVPLVDDTVQAGYTSRFAESNAVLTWSNDLLNKADFGAGIGGPSGTFVFESNANDELLVEGVHVESAHGTYYGAEPATEPNTDLRVGPTFHDHAIVQGIPFTLEVDGVFNGRDADLTACIPSNIIVDGTLSLDDERFEGAAVNAQPLEPATSTPTTPGAASSSEPGSTTRAPLAGTAPSEANEPSSRAPEEDTVPRSLGFAVLGGAGVIAFVALVLIATLGRRK